MSQKILKLGLKQILFVCIASIICIATLGLGLGLGFGTGIRNKTPAEALQNENRVLPRGVAQVSAGENHTMAIDSTGALWAFGSNSSGQLGNMSTNSSSTPINLTVQAGNPLYGKQIVQVSAGGSHTLAIDSQANLWAFGYGGDGQLGNMSIAQTNSTPINITAQPGNPLIGKQIVQISANSWHSMAIDSQGNLWAFGFGNSGRLGNMNTANSSTPINLTVQSGNPLNGKQIVQVSAGGSHTMAIDSVGNLWAFGFNSYGQLGDMSTTQSSTPINISNMSSSPIYNKQFVQVSAGGSHTLAIDNQGNLWAYGHGIFGRLGNMSTAQTNSTPINITAQSGNPLNGKQIVSVSAGANYTMAIDSKSNLWAFGYNHNGELGNMEDGISINDTPINITAQPLNPLNGKQIFSVSAGSYHTITINSQGSLWTCGGNYYGQLGNMTTSVNNPNSTPINITAQAGNPLNQSQFGRMQVSAGGNHSASIDASGNLWTFGHGGFGELGNMSTTGSSTPINITAQAGNPLNGKQIVQVSAGPDHTMAIDSAGNLWAFGANGSGQLGNMSTATNNSTPINITAQAGNPLNGRQIVQVSATYRHTMAIDSQGNLWAFGLGSYGRLGNMSTDSSSTPINITAQPDNPLNGKQIVQVSAGQTHTMAIDSQGNLWAFGDGSSGQLGNMSTAATNNTPKNITAQAGNPLSGKQIVQISSGSSFTIAIDSQGNLWAFGAGGSGRLGNMSTANSSTPINITAQAGNPLSGKQIVQVSVATSGIHAMAIDTQGNLWAFGDGSTGKLGNMSTANTNSTPINITAQAGNPLNGKQVVQVSAGFSHTMAIDSSGFFWAFGRDSTGQLGIMSTDPTNSTPINISAIASTSAAVAGNPNARISVRTNFTTGWGTANASGGAYTDWTANTLSSPAITKNNDIQSGRVRYEFDAGQYNTISELSINGTAVNMAAFSNSSLFDNMLYLRILYSDTRTIVEIDRINTRLFVPVIISATATRNVRHDFNFGANSHISSRMSVDFGAEKTSLSHTFVPNSWNDTTASVAPTTFTFSSRTLFSKITISRTTMSDVVITNIVNQTISVAGLSGTLIYTTGTTNTLIIILNSMEQYEYTWTIETYQTIQVQQIYNPPSGATSVANPALLTLNSSSGANWADLALASPANQFGKIFAGWYTHPDYTKGTRIITTEQLQQHITATGGAIVFLYARWA